ncbi:hypothetical protein Esi_0095_0086 [Ectocarpus siliculosus]|uniref:Uncharacterized protein n=1 Tax=Ectocarpus siliculosus TaxID=2880 RepID=D8LU72_ECTSI|nr:hypothetical protein Esi_0095_0086 [Ectocarpus siliculosus]|eukprot:CBN78114.1 hypothetical protein Esi_0095_0086 [Ectocarpus siliculosus]
MAPPTVPAHPPPTPAAHAAVLKQRERQEEEATLMRRKCAKSIYELSTRADKGPLLIGNGVIQALSALSLVEDPRTSRYVGASYVNIAALGREVCVDMLKNQVVRCLHRLWQRAYSLAHCRRTSDLSSVSKGSNSKDSNSKDSNSKDSNTNGGGSATSAPSVVSETDEEWSVRRCGLDVLDQAAVALCHLSVPIGAESIMMQERGMGAIMWYARGDHDNEQLKVVGLQCLVNFHRNTPNGTFHEAMLPCLKELGQSATTGIRRYTGQAICALGANKHGASQLLAGGVLTILANLSKPNNLTRDCESASGHDEGSGGDGAGGGGMGREGNPAAAADGLLLEAFAHAASNLTVANAEFVRQALIAPATVAEVLEILYLGGDGGGGDGGGGSVGAMKSNANVRGNKRAAACRLNSARVLRSIFSEADASDVARLVQLGFLRKTGQFFGQAAAQKDPKAQQLLAHSVWHLSATLTDVKPLESQPPPRPHPHPHRHPPTDSGSPAFTGEAISALSMGGLQQHQQQYKGVRRRSSSNSVLLPGQGESTTTTAKSSTATAATNNQGAARGVYGSRNRRRSSGGSSVVSVSVSEANTVRSSRASVRPVDRAKGSMILRQNFPGGALSAARGGLVGGRKLVRRRSSTLTEEEESLSETSSHRGGVGLEGGVPSALGSGLSLDTTSGAADSSPSEVDEKGPHVVACGVMHHLLRLAESGTTGFVRQGSHKQAQEGAVRNSDL